MRLWHYKLLPYLPDLQFKGQLRELVAIMHDWRDKGTTNHLLINKVMEYSKHDFVSFFMIYGKIYKEKYNRMLNSKITEFAVFLMSEDAPKEFVIEEKSGIRKIIYNQKPFKDWHNKEYLRVCMANLYEKHFFFFFKSRITDEEWQRLLDGYKAITGEEYQI